MTQQLEDSARFAPREGLVLEEIDDEVVILDLQNNVYFGLNEVAKLVWRGLEDDLSVGEVIDALLEEFEVERDVLAQDVRAFVGEALDSELVERVEG